MIWLTCWKQEVNTALQLALSGPMSDPHAAMLPGGRLHLQHGPIDLILGGDGPDLQKAFDHATDRFRTLLSDLMQEHPALCDPAGTHAFQDPVAQRMDRACVPFMPDTFVTPMAAVAGSVADDVLASAVSTATLSKFYVNNGGDIAFYLSPDATLSALGAEGPIEITFETPARGVATSGWRGRSLSLGIADAVTVLAKTAAAADVAATLIANAVDLPGHPSITRRPASDSEIAPELQGRLVTDDVGPISEKETAFALDRGAVFAERCLERRLIHGAQISLNGQSRVIQQS